MVKRPNVHSENRERRWRDLMREGQRGDKPAYESLLRELVPFLRRMTRRVVGNGNDAEDVVQEILISVHNVRHTYDPGRPFTPWLNAIARRRIADFLRKLYARRSHETLVETPPERTADLCSPGSVAPTSDDEIQHALAGLTAGQREAVELLRLRGLTLSEAAKQTGRSVASLKVTLHRATKALRRELK